MMRAVLPGIDQLDFSALAKRKPHEVWIETLTAIQNTLSDAEEPVEAKLHAVCDQAYRTCGHFGLRARNEMQQTPLLIATLLHHEEKTQHGCTAFFYVIKWLLTRQEKNRWGFIKDPGLNTADVDGNAPLNVAVRFKDEKDEKVDPLKVHRKELVALLLQHGVKFSAPPLDVDATYFPDRILVKMAVEYGNLFFLQQQLTTCLKLDDPLACLDTGYQVAMNNCQLEMFKFFLADYAKKPALLQHFNEFWLQDQRLYSHILVLAGQDATKQDDCLAIFAALLDQGWKFVLMWEFCITALLKAMEQQLPNALKMADFALTKLCDLHRLNWHFLLHSETLLLDIFTLAKQVDESPEAENRDFLSRLNQINYTADNSIASLLPPSAEEKSGSAAIITRYSKLIAIFANQQERESNPAFHIQKYCHRAAAYQEQKDDAAAVADYTAAIKMYHALFPSYRAVIPTDIVITAYQARSWIYAQQGRLVQATMDLCQVSKLIKGKWDFPIDFMEQIVALGGDYKSEEVAVPDPQLVQQKMLDFFVAQQATFDFKRAFWQILANKQSFLWRVFHPPGIWSAFFAAAPNSGSPLWWVATQLNEHLAKSFDVAGMDASTATLLVDKTLKNELAKDFPEATFPHLYKIIQKVDAGYAPGNFLT